MPYNTCGAISEPQVWGNRMLSGFTLNNSAIAPTGGYTYPKQTTLNPEAQFRMYKKNPIFGENGGSGPGQWSTSSSVAHADPRKENTYHWRRPASAPMSRNVKVIPSASGFTLNCQAERPIQPFDYSKHPSNRSLQRRVESRLKQRDPLAFHQYIQPRTEYSTSTTELFMKHTASSWAKNIGTQPPFAPFQQPGQQAPSGRPANGGGGAQSGTSHTADMALMTGLTRRPQSATVR